MKELLGILTSNHFTAVLVGALVTAIIQSSGATTVMVVGFVNAGIMTLTQAIGVIMGANIGTCITAWIVSLGQLGDAFKAFSPSLYAPLLVGIGAFLIMFSKKAKKQTIGEILVALDFSLSVWTLWEMQQEIICTFLFLRVHLNCLEAIRSLVLRSV